MGNSGRPTPRPLSIAAEIGTQHQLELEPEQGLQEPEDPLLETQSLCDDDNDDNETVSTRAHDDYYLANLQEASVPCSDDESSTAAPVDINISAPAPTSPPGTPPSAIAEPESENDTNFETIITSSADEPSMEAEAEAATRARSGLVLKVTSIPPSLLPPLRIIVNRLLGSISDLSEAGQQLDNAPLIEALHKIPILLQDCTSDAGRRKAMVRLRRLAENPEAMVPNLLLLSHRSRPSRRAAPPPADSNTDTANSREIPLKTIERLLKAGCAGKAARVLESSTSTRGIASPSRETSDRIQQLFPPSTDLQWLPRYAPGSDECLSLQQDDVDLGLAQLPKESAAGLSGWSYELVQLLCEGDDGELTRQELKRLFNHILHGKGGSVQAWNGDRIVPLIKSDNGLRPIVVGEVFLRILGRIAAAKISRSLMTVFAPLQWGIGVPNGTEVILHAFRLLAASVVDEPTGGVSSSDTPTTTIPTFDRPRGTPIDMVQTVDFRNAFNSISRSGIHSALEANEVGKSILSYFRWAYGSSTPIYYPDGQVAAVCAAGVKQGDPLGPLFFAFGLQQVLVQLARRFPDVIMMAYLDDISIYGPEMAMEDIMHSLTMLAARINLVVNSTKCNGLVHRASPLLETQSHAYPYPVTPDSIKILGGYIGTEAHQLDRYSSDLHKTATSMHVLHRLTPNYALPLLQACINTRPVYVMRTALPKTILHAISAFDQAVDQCLLSICGSTSSRLPPTASLLRSVPQKYGGLSLPRLNLLAKPAFVASLLRSLFIASDLHPNLVPHLRRAIAIDTYYSIIIEQIHPSIIRRDNPRSMLALWPLDSDSDNNTTDDAATPMVEIPSQRQLVEQHVTPEIMQSLELALANDPRGRAWVISSAYAGSFSPFTSFHSATALPHDAYRRSLSLRLLLHPTSEANGDLYRCQMCQRVDDVPSDEGFGELDRRFHGLNCPQGQRARKLRHDLLRNALGDLLKRLFGAANVVLEPNLGLPQVRVQPDIRLRVGMGVVLVDLTIVNPACTSHVNHGSSTTEGATATFAEVEKRRKYADALTALHLSDDAFVPFAVECTGRLGSSAASFLQLLPSLPGASQSVDAQSAISFFEKRLRTICLRGNARCLQDNEQRHRALVPQ